MSLFLILLLFLASMLQQFVTDSGLQINLSKFDAIPNQDIHDINVHVSDEKKSYFCYNFDHKDMKDKVYTYSVPPLKFQ